MLSRLGLFVAFLYIAASVRRHNTPQNDGDDNCARLVPGAEERNSAWRRANDCKCPKNSVLVGEDVVCKEFVGQRYFPLSLPAGMCRCQEESAAVFSDMAHNILPCIDPDGAEKSADASLEDLQQIISKLRLQKVDNDGLKLDGWANRPFASNSLSASFPWHMTLGLVHSESKYTNRGPTGNDSFCFEFDYSNASTPDPSGCRLFEKSFRPLKELRNCIIGHLENDSIWTNRRGQAWDEVKKGGAADLDGFESADYDNWCQNSVYAYTTVGPVSLPVQLCSIIDTIRRAEEMIKFALFKKGGLTTLPAKVPSHVLKKIQQTTTWPGMKQGGQHSVSQETADAIKNQCFRVKSDNAEQYFNFLQRIGSCLPLMYDKTEIGDGFGFQDGYVKLGQPKAYNQPVNLHLHHVYNLPPVCGRLALAAIPGIQSARYNLAPSLQSLWSADKKTPWLDCGVQDTDYTNCRKAFFCWEKSLNLMCGIDQLCCPGEALQAKTRHEYCKASHEGRCAGMEAE